ncbi:hypothetical protein AVEN_225001-1 [Araneus ventricosus]|uniref:Uncharacterized protein n=1 Tax=Araneus ventricosus TaxID=182803 RepID=A0A4Y2SXS9_ARAVE|nr:hypothetical protein AVEN_225001-1 [Araneus ventricosus]
MQRAQFTKSFPSAMRTSKCCLAFFAATVNAVLKDFRCAFRASIISNEYFTKTHQTTRVLSWTPNQYDNTFKELIRFSESTRFSCGSDVKVSQ